MSVSRNEQLKLSANFLNTLGAAFVITGTIAPIIAILYGVNSAPSSNSMVYVGSIATACFFFGIGLHFVARNVLRKIS